MSLLAGDIYGKHADLALDPHPEGALLPGLARQPRPHGAGVEAPPRQHPRRRGPGIVSRPAGRRRGPLRRRSRWLGASGVAAGACAEELPLPGPVVDGPVAQAAGAGGRQGQRAALGARHRRRRVALRRLPRLRPDQHLPVAGAVLRLPRPASCAPTATARARSCSPASGSSSTSASARRCRPRARTTRRAAACRTSPAPSRSAPTSSSSSGSRATGKMKVELRMPRARGDHARALAARDRPHVLAQPEPRHQRPARQGWNLGLLAGPLFADQRYHQYFYGVAPEFATAEPARLRGPGRLRRLARHRRVLAPLRQRLARRLRPLRQPARRGFAPSPLVRKRNHASPPASASHGSSRLRASAYVTDD